MAHLTFRLVVKFDGECNQRVRRNVGMGRRAPIIAMFP